MTSTRREIATTKIFFRIRTSFEDKSKNKVYKIFRNLIKTIRRKNNIKNQVNPEDEERALIDYCNKELNSAKRVSKTTLEKALNLLMKTLNETTEKQKFIENKVESLGKQNEEFIIQNQQMLHEIKAKR